MSPDSPKKLSTKIRKVNNRQSFCFFTDEKKPACSSSWDLCCENNFLFWSAYFQKFTITIDFMSRISGWPNHIRTRHVARHRDPGSSPPPPPKFSKQWKNYKIYESLSGIPVFSRSTSLPKKNPRYVPVRTVTLFCSHNNNNLYYTKSIVVSFHRWIFFLLYFFQTNYSFISVFSFNTD